MRCDRCGKTVGNNEEFYRYKKVFDYAKRTNWKEEKITTGIMDVEGKQITDIGDICPDCQE